MASYVMIDGAAYPLNLSTDGAGGYRLDGAPLADPATTIARDGDRLWVQLDGRAWELVWQDAVNHHAAEAGGSVGNVARAPMPGAVILVSVAVGDAISAGDTMMVIESMKLETAIRAPRDGIVATVHVAIGQTFERDALLVSLEETV